MRDKKTLSKSSASVDDFMKSVYEALSVKVLAESAANAPPTDEIDDDLAELEAQIERASVPMKKPVLSAPRKRTTR